MNWKALITMGLCLMLVIGLSCSSSSTVSPDINPQSELQSQCDNCVSRSNFYLMGLWEVHLDAITGEVQVVPLRGVDFTCNVTRFIDDEPFDLLFENLVVDTTSPVYTDISLDIGLRHPFPHLQQFTGFDVLGVFMGDGSQPYPGDETLNIAGESDQRMLNPDGYTRWFNRDEFHSAGEQMPLFGYTPGIAGNLENPSANLNPYKYFADGLEADDDAFEFLADNASDRGHFSAHSINWRHYALRFQNNNINFQYAIIAHWEPPEGDPPFELDDFPNTANADEAVVFDVNCSSNFYYLGDDNYSGQVNLELSVWDWSADFNSSGVMEEYEIRCYSDAWSGAHEVPTDPVDQDDYYFTYDVGIAVTGLESSDPLPIWIEVSYPGLNYENIYEIPNHAEEPLTGYFLVEVPIEYQSPELSPVDVTPPWLGFAVEDVAIDGDYAYIACRSGLQIIDVSDPYKPVWIKWVDLGGSCFKISVRDGYAYATKYSDYCFEMIDVDPPELAQLVHSVETTGAAGAFDISGDCAYVICTTSYDGDIMQIIDIGNPESAYLAHSVDLEHWFMHDVSVSDGYAYVTHSFGPLMIFDVDPLESAYLVNTLHTPGNPGDLEVIDGYAYLADAHNAFLVIDVDPPESANIIVSIEEAHDPKSLAIYNGYAYVNDDFHRLDVIDIDPIESTHFVKEIDVDLSRLVATEEYAYVVDWGYGFSIVDINPLETAGVIRCIPRLSRSRGVCGSGNKLYLGTSYGGIEIIDVTQPESAYFLFVSTLEGTVQDIYLTDEFVYVANDNNGLVIMEINPDGSLSVVNTVETLDVARGVDVSNGYAYIADDDGGLHVIDVDPYGLASIVCTVETPEKTRDVVVAGDYAFVACETGLLVVDIAIPEAAVIVHDVPMPDMARGVFISGDYAYVANSTTGVQIVDISLPESAFIYRTVDTPYTAFDVFKSGGYAYVADFHSGLTIIDVDPLESAHFVQNVEIASQAVNVWIDGEYAYVSGSLTEGLYIFRLW